ncbi:TetR/AcrR family transcriptional regulator [Roseovarius amoyensis]|uniref:TetR/AcrR family transcriptional regulator n=1 Tax=Roseovarius amoyensis TaxID=2211448 RepID=UPI000DBE2A85|nr:TetR/AcrR family transcriptional regulator [Roseovarius amoyensis]
MQKIADEAGFSVGLFYQYIADKKERLFLILDQTVVQYEEQIAVVKPDTLDLAGSLRDLLFGTAKVVSINTAGTRSGGLNAP